MKATNMQTAVFAVAVRHLHHQVDPPGPAPALSWFVSAQGSTALVGLDHLEPAQDCLAHMLMEPFQAVVVAGDGDGIGVGVHRDGKDRTSPWRRT